MADTQRMAHTGSGVWNIAAGGGEWSDEVYRIFGLDRQNFDPQIDSIMGRFHPDDRKLPEKLMQQALENRGQYTFEARIQSPDGHIRYLRSTSEGNFDDNGRLIEIHGIVMDITDRKQAEEALKESEQKLRGIISESPIGISIYDSAGQCILANDSLAAMIGTTRAQVLEQNYTTLESWQRSGLLAKAQTAVREKSAIRHEVITVSSFGKDVFLDCHLVPFGSDGLLFMSQDITVRKQLEGQLLQAQKMEAIGQLAGGVAHDFNNMLSVILGYAELIKSRLPPDDPLFKDVLEIEKAAVHSRDVTRQLLAFSRKQIIAPKTVNLNTLITAMQKTLARLIGENIDLRFFPGKELGKIRFDPSQVDQILVNLAVNARDAMRQGGRLTIETANVDLDEVYCRAHIECRPGSYVLLTVSDEGTGMDKETLAHVFEPFFTTKAVGQGTGLGLATVYVIVKQNGGFINVYSEAERGTTFKIYIPRIMEESEVREKPGEIPSAPVSGTVLLVEDDDMVRKMTSAMLAKLGYTVVVAETPSEALSFCAKQETPIDLLITDVVMPKMSGTELRDRITALRPAIKVLFMSGYTSNVIVHHGVLEEAVDFVQKPFTLKDLARKVRDAIGDP
ncbi:MAG: response regulator [Desulfobacterales bacterium]|nr:MAG: response regulator [Desulfobacterales bacterium]